MSEYRFTGPFYNGNEEEAGETLAAQEDAEKGTVSEQTVEQESVEAPVNIEVQEPAISESEKTTYASESVNTEESQQSEEPMKEADQYESTGQ